MNRWYVRFPIPTRHAVPRFIQSTISTNVHVVCVRGVNPQAVIIHVLEAFWYVLKTLSAIGTNMGIRIHTVNGVYIGRVTYKLNIIVTRCFMSRTLVPAFSAIGRGKGSVTFNCGIKHVWICWRNIHTNSSNITAREPITYFIPMRSAVRAFVHRTVRPTAEVSVNVSSALVCCSIKCLRIARIYVYFVKASMLVYK